MFLFGKAPVFDLDQKERGDLKQAWVSIASV
jgi:hypothetical protein